MKYSAFKSVVLAMGLILGLGAAQAEDAPKGEVALFLTIKTQDGQRDTLVDLWDKHLKMRAADNADHVSYVFALDMNDPNTVYISEVYATQAAFQTNSQSEWFGAYMAEVGPLLAGEPGFAMAMPHWVK
ncbi:MAG: antibiotic biosynthesis monooxygenase [Pseudomonadota bacterium]